MPPNEGEVEENVPIDIKSRIAAFSQGAAPSVRLGPAPAVSRVGKPTLRKTPSTSQLLPAWQQQQQRRREAEDHSNNELLKPEYALSSRPRSNTGDEARGASSGERSIANSPKLGVKSIIALYGQQGQAADDGHSTEMPPRSREVSYEGSVSQSPRPSSMETLRRAVPPPALPPRPKNSNALLSQTNTGSSNHSSSSNGVSASTTMATPPSSYTPYLRKGNGATQLGVGSLNGGADNTVPALPRRQLGAAQSLEDLTLDPSHSSFPSSTMRKFGSGPKWASSSSGNLTMQGGTGSQSPTIAPAVPPRVSASVTNSPSSFTPPPPKRTLPHQSPVAARHRSTTASSFGSSIPSPMLLSSATTASPSSTSEFATRSAKSSLSTQARGSSSPVIAPPPRHVDIRRMGPRTHISSSSASSIKSVKKQQRKRVKTLQSGAVYTKEPGDAEQRYTLLFYRLLKDQQAKTGDVSRLNKRTVVRVWKQSQLEDWFLAKVWDATTTTGDVGVDKGAFTRAMSAIDYELSRRQTQRQNRRTID